MWPRRAGHNTSGSLLLYIRKRDSKAKGQTPGRRHVQAHSSQTTPRRCWSLNLKYTLFLPLQVYFIFITSRQANRCLPGEAPHRPAAHCWEKLVLRDSATSSSSIRLLLAGNESGASEWKSDTLAEGEAGSGEAAHVGGCFVFFFLAGKSCLRKYTK